MYKIKIVQKAKKSLLKLPQKTQIKIVERIDGLEQNPKPRGAKKLTNQEGYRIRVGDWRVLYIVDSHEKIVTIVRIGHRREVYKK